MESFHNAVSKALHANAHLLAGWVAEGFAENPYGKGEVVVEQAIQQLVEGMLSILDEALEGSGSEIRETYLETVVPSLIRRGRNPSSMVYTGVTFAVAVSNVLARELPEDARESGLTWFARFHALLSADIVAAACRAQALAA